MHRGNLPWYCKKCGLDCTVIGGSKQLRRSCEKKFESELLDPIEVCRNA